MFSLDRKSKGFTLVELLVVIAIICILAAILFPVFAKARRAAKQTACLNNLKQIGTAIKMYMNDNSDTFPYAIGFGPAFHYYKSSQQYQYLFGVTTAANSFADTSTSANSPYRDASHNPTSRFLPNLLSGYVKNYKIWICPFSDLQSTWHTGSSTDILFQDNSLHGVAQYGPFPEPYSNMKAQIGASGFTDPIWSKYDPPTCYMYNAWAVMPQVDGTSGNVTWDPVGGRITIAGSIESICSKPADAPLVWDAMSGLPKPDGSDTQLSHIETIAVLYVDGHTKAIHISKQLYTKASALAGGTGNMWYWWDHAGWIDINENGVYTPVRSGNTYTNNPDQDIWSP